jgi:hypothetical protein
MPGGTWPDVDELELYVGEVNTDQIDVLQDSLDAAIAYIGWRCDDELELIQDTGSDYYYDEAVPANLQEATKMLASRLFRRRLSPEGVAGFGEFGAVRVIAQDPDIEALITPNRSWGFA